MSDIISFRENTYFSQKTNFVETPGDETENYIRGIHGTIVQLTNGSLLAFGRGNDIHGMMAQSISHDMSRTWNYTASTFPVCPLNCTFKQCLCCTEVLGRVYKLVNELLYYV